MLIGSHETPVDCLKRHIKAWKMRGPAGDSSQGHWSDETICDFIVQAHNHIGGPARTGIVFAMEGTGDEARRKTANARRIMRYLTDEPNTEFESLQLLNLLPSILAAMPSDLRDGFLNDYLSPLDLSVRGVERGDASQVNHTSNLVNVSRETAEAVSSIANLVDGATKEELRIADRELAQAGEAIRRAHSDVRLQLGLKVH